MVVTATNAASAAAHMIPTAVSLRFMGVSVGEMVTGGFTLPVSGRKAMFRKTMVIAVMTMMLAGCGIKPDFVQAPPGSPEPDEFPHTYPDPSTDPAPKTYRR